MYVCMYACMHVCMYVCVCMYVYHTYICIYLYIYIYVYDIAHVAAPFKTPTLIPAIGCDRTLRPCMHDWESRYYRYSYILIFRVPINLKPFPPSLDLLGGLCQAHLSLLCSHTRGPSSVC